MTSSLIASETKKTAETDKEEAKIFVNGETPNSVEETQTVSNEIENEGQKESVELFDIAESSGNIEENDDVEYIPESDSSDSASGEAEIGVVPDEVRRSSRIPKPKKHEDYLLYTACL
ncbi:hypothetical protein QE152_g36230 [Popillia japonica]|uniref:Uncharacterized protein n=1 Tax=Popillia japonica TaxID=7064 RepID=A0AAW1IDL9_POPJA